MTATPNRWWAVLLTVVIGNAGAVEQSNPLDLVAVVDGIERLPATAKEFDKFYRARGRVAGVLKGNARIGDRIEVVVNGAISEQRNDCCKPERTYFVFLAPRDGRFYFRR